MTNIVTADSSGNIGCASPIESILKGMDEALVKSAELTYNSTTGDLKVVVKDIAGGSAASTVTLPGDFAGISAWASGTTDTLVLGSDGKLYLANPAGAPATHNPIAKTNDVDWFGPFSSVNTMLEYALSGDSFLAGTNAYTQDAAPGSPTTGMVWNTTANTAAPYAQNVTYQWNGSAWNLIAGRPQAVGTCSGVHESAVGVGTGFNDINLTLFSNSLNAGFEPAGFTIPRDGYYSVEANVNPGSLFETFAFSGTRPIFYSLGIHVNGSLISSTAQNVIMGASNGTYDSFVLGTSCNTFLNGDFAEGDFIECVLYITGLRLSFSITVKVTQLG